MLRYVHGPQHLRVRPRIVLTGQDLHKSASYLYFSSCSALPLHCFLRLFLSLRFSCSPLVRLRQLRAYVDSRHQRLPIEIFYLGSQSHVLSCKCSTCSGKWVVVSTAAYHTTIPPHRTLPSYELQVCILVEGLPIMQFGWPRSMLPVSLFGG
jgi:hypothetical protein